MLSQTILYLNHRILHSQNRSLITSFSRFFLSRIFCNYEQTHQFHPNLFKGCFPSCAHSCFISTYSSGQHPVGSATSLPSDSTISSIDKILSPTPIAHDSSNIKESALTGTHESAPIADSSTDVNGDYSVSNSNPQDELIVDAPHVEIVTEEAVIANPQDASVPLMITRNMRSRLIQRGYTESQIKEMTPKDAHLILLSVDANNE